jgi:hypothetical protein
VNSRRCYGAFFLEAIHGRFVGSVLKENRVIPCFRQRSMIA